MEKSTGGIVGQRSLARGVGQWGLAVVLLALLAGAGTPTPPAMTGEQILQAMDRNRDYTSIVFDGKMTIHVRDRVRVKTFQVKSLAKERKALVTFTNPEDRGTTFLMIGDDLWIYFADEDDTVKISGQMLRQGMMGSDVSYQDALDADTLTAKYAVDRDGDAVVEDRPCYVVTLTAKVRRVPYPKRKIWVDKAWFVPWREEMYARSGKLLKVSKVLEVKAIGNRHVAVRSEVSSTLRKSSRTLFEMHHIAFDEPLSEDLFTLRALKH